MKRFIDIDQTPVRPAQSGDDAAQWVELYFPDIDNLLQRLVRSHADEHIAMRSRLRSWAMLIACAIGFTCLPGYDTDASSLSESENLDPIFFVEQPVSAKADRLPLIQLSDHVGAATSASLGEADWFEPVLRGSIEHVTFAAPLPASPPSNVPKSRRSATRAGPAKAPLETPSPAAPPPSLLEKLFGMILQGPRQT